MRCANICQDAMGAKPTAVNPTSNGQNTGFIWRVWGLGSNCIFSYFKFYSSTDIQTSSQLGPNPFPFTAFLQKIWNNGIRHVGWYVKSPSRWHQPARWRGQWHPRCSSRRPCLPWKGVEISRYLMPSCVSVMNTGVEKMYTNTNLTLI